METLGKIKTRSTNCNLCLVSCLRVLFHYIRHYTSIVLEPFQNLLSNLLICWSRDFTSEC